MDKVGSLGRVSNLKQIRFGLITVSIDLITICNGGGRGESLLNGFFGWWIDGWAIRYRFYDNIIGALNRSWFNFLIIKFDRIESFIRYQDKYNL